MPANPFASQDYLPHGFCLNWSPGLLSLHVLSDAIIVLSYYAIPLMMAYFILRREEKLPYPWLIGGFALLIATCGTTHLFSIITLWIPVYWLDGVIKALTAAVSLFTAVAMLKLIPRALKQPTVVQLEAEIAKTKMAEIALQRKSHLLSESQKMGHIGSWAMDIRTGLISWSDEAYRIYGVVPDAFEHTVDALLNLIHPDDRVTMEGWINDGIAGKQPPEQHFRIFSENGIRYLAGRGGAQYDEMKRPVWIAGIVQDITEHKKMELELQEYQRHLEKLVTMQVEVRAILQAAINGIITINAQGLINIFNPAAESIFGYQAEEVQGCNVSMLMPEPYHSQHDGYIQKFLQSGEKKIIGIGREVVGLRKDGETFPMYLAVGNTTLKSGESLFVGFVSDITELKRNQQALLEAKNAAEAGIRTKAAFIANISHEIRTPMNAILGFSEVILQDEQLAAANKQHARTIYTSAKSLLRIINDVLDASKLESGKFTLESVCFHLPNLLADTIRILKGRATEKNLALDYTYDSRLPPRFLGDPTRLRQVIVNLVGNAIKFTEKGSIKLFVEPGNEVDTLHFAVQDSGIGMSPEQIVTVFEPFLQADSSTTRRYGGTGLGASISKEIVELMGGTIWVNSQLGVGSMFHFTVHLPQALMTENCLYDDDSPVVEGYLSPRFFHILLAEDIEANATLATLRLKQQGHKVDWVQNGRLAVNAFKEQAYDLILMDVQMPEMDGLDAARAIRALEAETGKRIPIPILALTASVMRADYDQCIDAGMNCVVGKPVDFNLLFAEMERIVPVGCGAPNSRSKVRMPSSDPSVIDFSPLDGVVDYVQGINVWRNPIVYAQALQSFAAERGANAEKIAAVLARSPDAVEVAHREAHALKGLASNLAIKQVAVISGQIVATLKSADRPALDGLLASLSQALAQTVAKIAELRLPPLKSNVESPAPAYDHNAVCLLLKELRTALNALNPDAAEPLLTDLARYLSQTELTEIYRELNNFQFEAAIQQVIRLANKLQLQIK